MAVLKKSEELIDAEKEYLGKSVTYLVRDILDRKSKGRKITGCYTGIVQGCTDNQALIEDELEGYSEKDPIMFTGSLIIKPDDGAMEDIIPLDDVLTNDNGEK